MVKVREVIVVEGRYDKNTLLQIVDATVLETNGFGIFKDKAQLDLLRQAAERRGLIIFTDSDGAGFVIRNYLKGAIDPKLLKHAYIPDLPGKERRKRTPGKEGKLGVEGMTPEIIIEALRRAGATMEDAACKEHGGITKGTLFALGLSGGKDSEKKRKALLKALNLPEHMSANAMVQALNLLLSEQELTELAEKLNLE